MTNEIFFPALFISAITLIVFVYAGYPALMFAISRLSPRPVIRADIQPRVSLIIAARNERRDIAAKLENALALDYPKDLLQIIVASDCSDDGTDEIVRGLADRGVILSRQSARDGKTRAQHRAALISNGDILVFSDATTRLEPDALRKLLRAFADPSVGCVAGRLVYRPEGSSVVATGCRSYWDYESLLKSWESAAGSIVGVSGCFYAVRRSCYAKLASDMIDDFVIATEMRLHGLRAVYEPEAVCDERAPALRPPPRRAQTRDVYVPDFLPQDAAILDPHVARPGFHRQLPRARRSPLLSMRLLRADPPLLLGVRRMARRQAGSGSQAVRPALLFRPGQRGGGGRLREIHARRGAGRLGASAKLAAGRAFRRIEHRGLRIED